MLFTAPVVVKADESRQGRFFFGGDLGYSWVGIQRKDTHYSESWLYGALRAEYALQQQLLLGVEGSGWTDQDKVDSPIAEDVLAFMMTSRTYPVQDSFIFLKAAWGYAKHRYWESSSKGDTSGTAYLVGVGYDIGISSFILSYSRSDLEQGSYKAITVSAGFAF
jgi:hypothetical protein